MEELLKFTLLLLSIWIPFGIMLYNVRSIKNNQQPTIIKRDEIKNYNEEEIIKHLEYIVSETISEYVLFNITPKEIYYINTSMEEEMIESVKDTVTAKLSETLLNNLRIIYNPDYIGTFIGMYIYIKVTEYVIQFNVENKK